MESQNTLTHGPTSEISSSELLTIPKAKKAPEAAMAESSQTVVSEGEQTGDERLFTCFPTLAAELRLKVWESIEIKPRVIYIEDVDDNGDEFEVKFWSEPTLQPLLGVNSESRTFAAKQYTPMSHGSHIQINPAIDILVFQYCHTVRWFIKRREENPHYEEDKAIRDQIISVIKHVVIGQRASEIFENLLDYQLLKQVDSLTLLEGFSGRQSRERNFRSSLADLWKDHKVQPKLLAGSLEEIWKLEQDGDADWLLKKIADA